MIKIQIYKEFIKSTNQFFIDVDFTLKKGSFNALFGGSGSGKTSILNVISGIKYANKGFVSVSDVVWLDTDKKINLPINKRKIGVVFQNSVLFPHLTVYENLVFSKDKNDSFDLMNELIELFSISDLLNSSPDALSGGQKQKVAIVRALVRNPDLLLLDEPFSAIDAEQRKQIQNSLIKAHQKLKFTALVVSHDLEEVVRLSENIFMLENGIIVKKGSAFSLFEQKDEEDSIRLTGIVLSIEKTETIQKMKVLIENEIHTIERMDTNFQIGDRIVLDLKKNKIQF